MVRSRRQRRLGIDVGPEPACGVQRRPTAPKDEGDEMSARTIEEKDKITVAQVTGLQLGSTTSPATVSPTSMVVSGPGSAGGKKSKKKKMIFALLGAVVLIALVIGGIVWSKGGTVTVQTTKVARQDALSAIVTASGEIKPPTADLANVNASSMGKITEIYVKEGDTVKKGQLLLKTEAIQANADVDRAKGNRGQRQGRRGRVRGGRCRRSRQL